MVEFTIRKLKFATRMVGAARKKFIIYHFIQTFTYIQVNIPSFQSYATFFFVFNLKGFPIGT